MSSSSSLPASETQPREPNSAVEDPRAPGRSVRPSQLEEFRERYRTIDSGEVSAPPADESDARELAVKTESVRPRMRGSDAPPPDHDAMTFEVAKPAEGRPRSAGALPGGSTYPVGSVNVALMMEAERDRSWSDRHGFRLFARLALAVLGLAAVVILITRPAFLFPSAGKPISGPFKSKHLGLSLTFPPEPAQGTAFIEQERWRHAEDLDDKETTKQGYTRKVSVFYQGKTATDFASRFDLITLSKEGEAMNEDLARSVGASETLDAASRRQCNAYLHGRIRGTLCTAIAQGLGNPTPSFMIEAYFPIGSKIVFARGRVKVPQPGGGSPQPGGPPGGLGGPQSPGGLSPMGGPVGGPMGGLMQQSQEVTDRLAVIQSIIDTIEDAN